MAEELIRHANKVIISKIIKTDNNLSRELAQQYIDAVKKTNPYSENINSDNTYINTYRFKQMLKSILYDALINYSLTNPQESYALIKRLVDEDHTNINHFNNVMKRYTKPIDYFSKVLK